jgi:hypothetical protein
MAGETLAAIDPGATECAVARFDDGLLMQIGFVGAGISHHPRGLMAWSTRAVYEMPQADGRNAPADDLIAVAIAGATCAAWCSAVVQAYQPRQWKGSLPKAAHHHQVWTTFTEAEQAILGGAATLAAIEAACARGAKARWQKRGALAGNHFYSDRELPTVGGLKITHDLLDAAALGLYDLRRLKGTL